jgi:hypothetical protein
MTYTFKLARRLAVSRDFGVLTALVLVAACMGDSTAPDVDPASSTTTAPIALQVSPRSVTIETNQIVRFRGHERGSRSDLVSTPVVWVATGGVINATGTFSSTTSGSFKVIARGRGRKLTDTAVVVVVPPAADLVRIVLSPGTVTVDTGATRAFTATGYLSDSSTAPVGIIWSATGGTVDPAGLYTAGKVAGSYLVIATNTAATIADTAVVTVTAPVSTVPPSTPAPTLAEVFVSPTSVTLASGGTRQFYAYGRNSAGDSIAVTVAFTAAGGGTITSGGLYTAGPTAGSVKVMAASDRLADTAVVTVAATAPSVSGLGIPFGPFGAWAGPTLQPNTALFSLSQGSLSASDILDRIAGARANKVKLLLAMTGGKHSNYLTNGVFDLAKWEAKMDTYNTAAIKTAIAAGVADGTIVGAALLDEPNHASWGGNITKPMLDQMATYVKAMFPTLSVGVNNGPVGFRWRATERYRVVDYVLNQYNWWVTKGNVVAWRDSVLAQAALDGVGVGFSLNLLDGGVVDKDGTYDCTGAGQAGIGTYSPSCRMTPTQVRDYGLALGPAGCALLMWQYDSAFMADPGNLQVFKDLAGRLASLPRKSCRRTA